jgi:choline dehydrogenase-like flavoprotein
LAWFLLRQGIDVTLLAGSRVFSPSGPDRPVKEAYLYSNENRSQPQALGDFRIIAGIVVLACGAVANARQLLLSDVGNDSGLVGRFLAVHAISNGANAVLGEPVLTPSEQQSLSYQDPGPKYNPMKFLAGLLTPNGAAKGGGPVQIGSWNDIQSRMVYNGHHLGTTRMAATELEGVVDRNLKVFGLDNLYVAGSSVWASPGIENPTFSIVAFSIRLAEHLTQRLQDG